MKKLPVGWSSIEEAENLEINGVDFKLAAQVIKNVSSLRIRHLFSDYLFIGPTNDLLMILSVKCIEEDGFRKIISARKATRIEANSYFDHLSQGPLK